ncbi:MAG: DUF4256 domain-containing protein [Peptoniphilaceae bacterium]|nr:DUF4256 domain-containing protein [Peptoniphilaceae bacterium]MDY6019118.1 DUF4256 domain-containing protein [Anaerococcus sp.]
MDNLKEILEKRFKKNIDLHRDLDFATIWDKISKNQKTLEIINNMEESGGCPDFITVDDKLLVFDTYDKIPACRESLCYDREAFESRKNNKPKSDVLSEVHRLGSNLITEDLYYKIQQIFSFDQKISCRVKTPLQQRKLGGAIFCDRRYDRVFTYHNGAESYYSSRGYRTYIFIE